MTRARLGTHRDKWVLVSLELSPAPTLSPACREGDG